MILVLIERLDEYEKRLASDSSTRLCPRMRNAFGRVLLSEVAACFYRRKLTRNGWTRFRKILDDEDDRVMSTWAN